MKTKTVVEPIPKVYLRYKDCEECGVEFGYSNNRRQYCTKKCADRAKYRRTYVKRKTVDGVLKTCDNKKCENQVRHYPRQLKVDANRFCSTKCFNESLMTNKPLICRICGNKFYCSKSQQALRNRKTCSVKCRLKLQETKVIGSVKLRKGMMQKAQNLCNRAARLRDLDENKGANCISCNKWYPFERLDGGHFIPSTSSAVRFDERNINAQCWKCNRYLSGNGRHYVKGMIRKYGQETVDELEAMEFETKKWTVEELEQIIHDSREQIRFYEKEL